MSGIKILSDYPGANIIIHSISDGETVLVVSVEQDIRDTGEWWFYWNFCVDGAQGKEILFQFGNGEVLGPWGPCVRRENSVGGAPGKWEWAGAETLVDRKSFRYRFGPDDSRVYFAFSFPYQLSDHFRFVDTRAENASDSGIPPLRTGTLVVSEKGRAIPIVEIGKSASGKKIILTARHHACESPASYQLEGIMEHFLGTADSLLTTEYSILVVPFMDLDGVEDGDQGKSRIPHDHNRDYGGTPLYSSVAAVKRLAAGNDIIGAFDLHSPWKWGGRDDHFFIVGQPEKYQHHADAFGEILTETVRALASPGDILYDRSQDVPFGMDWNTGIGNSFSRFFRERGVDIAVSTEMPYFGVEGMAHTPEKLKKFGTCFAVALEKYFRQE